MSGKTPLPLVAIPADVRQIGIHPFHAVGEKYINAVAHGAGALPILLPAFGRGEDLEPLFDHIDLDELIARLDGLFLPGSPSNVEPHHYDGAPFDAETMRDPQRDVTTLPLITAALAAGLPLFAVCRGFQELNVALGGTLHQRVHELPGMLDHREDSTLPRAAQYAPAHPVTLEADGVIAGILGATEIMVNSLHAQGIDRLADRLAVEGRAPDGLIEAVRVKDAPGFAIAVQWHPEWRVRDNPQSLALFRAFGDACRARAEARKERVIHGNVA